jgi:flavin reductase (DIM6/NTAB) family NADH-FMN oxidoreductase RutF
MRTLAAADLQPRDRHDLMLSTILPRPIAWVMSMDRDGITNLAPFSYFNGLSATPPMISISIGKRRSGEWKDTRRNIEATREFVVHVVDEPHAHHMVETSADHPPPEDHAGQRRRRPAAR